VLHAGLFSSIAASVALLLGPGAASQPFFTSSHSHSQATRSAVYAQSNDKTSAMLERKGIYVGEADSHSVAIRTAGQEWCYQTQGTTMLSLNGLENGDPVWIQYKEEKIGNGVSQLVITKIKKMDARGR
jgi:hypothetical protein